MRKIISKIAGLMLGLSLTLGFGSVLLEKGQSEVRAADVLYYTLDGTDSSQGTNGYATESSVTQGGISWKITANTTINPWRVGGKSITNVARPFYSTSSINTTVTKVVVTTGTNGLDSVDSTKLIVASDASFANVIEEVSATFVASSTMTYQSTKDWKNAYYKFEFNCTKTANSNAFFQFKKAEFYRDDSVAQTYSVSYSANATANVDTTGLPSAHTDLADGTTQTLSNTGPTRWGYTFGGWAATENGTTPIQQVTISGADVIVYAIWNADTTVKGAHASNPYTVQEAKAAIDAGVNLSDNYVAGIISQVDTPSSFSGQICYWISDDGTTSDQMEIYWGRGLNNQNFSAVTDVEVGATIVNFGTLKKHNSTYEFDTGSYLISYTPVPGKVLDYISVSGAKTEYKVGDSFVEPTVTATYTDESTKDVTASATFSGFNSSATAVSQTITVTYEENEVEKSTSYTISITAIVTNTYMKVSSELEDYSGHYLIVCETENYVSAFNGSLGTLDATSNFESVTITSSQTTLSETFEFVISRVSGKDTYTIRSASGKYIGKTADSNGLDENASTQYENSIAFVDSAITVTGSGGAQLRFNKTSGQTRFRYFKKASYATMEPIVLYKRVSSTAEQFAEDLLAQTSETCSQYDSSNNLGNKSKFTSIWSELSGANHYSALSSSEKLLLVEADRDESGSTIERAVARYDFITGKYSLTNFIEGRTPVSFAGININQSINENSSSTIVIVVVALISISSIGVLLVIKRKRSLVK